MHRHSPLRPPHDLRSRLAHDRLATPGTSVRLSLATALGAGAAAYLTWRALRIPPRPTGVQPVDNFDVSRFLGRWYEIARIDHRSEKGLVRSRAEFSLAPNGCIQVINRGFDIRHNRWKQARGKAQFVGRSNEAALKVSFCRPFYVGYNVVALDEQYQWAMVIGSSLDCFRILSRSPVLADSVRQQLLAQADQIGIDLERILWVMQDGANPTGG